MMNKKEIKNIIELFIAWNGETEAIDTANIDSAVEFIGSSLQPVSEDLENAALEYATYYNKNWSEVKDGYIAENEVEAFKAGAKWQKEHLWKPATGDDLPEIDREVIALLDNGKVVFAHRPQEYWDGKDIITGKVTRNYPKTYDKGGWNIPDAKYWLNVGLPKEIKL